MKWIEIKRKFYEREVYWPAFGETQRREWGQEIGPEPEPEQPSRPRLALRRRRRPWK